MSSSRIHFRVNEAELGIVKGIQNCGDFRDVSSTVRFCIHFTSTILAILPEAIGESFIDSLGGGENNFNRQEKPENGRDTD